MKFFAISSWRVKLFFLLLLTLSLSYYFLFCYSISTGKRVGNLTKLSKKGRLIKTWEGTLNEGLGEKQTTFFSISNEKLGLELFNYEGKQVVIYYEEHFFGWPRDTNYTITSWAPYHGPETQQAANANATTAETLAMKMLSKALFCSFLGTLKNNPTLYQQVKDYIQAHNIYVYEQYGKCIEELPTK